MPRTLRLALLRLQMQLPKTPIQPQHRLQQPLIKPPIKPLTLPHLPKQTQLLPRVGVVMAVPVIRLRTVRNFVPLKKYLLTGLLVWLPLAVTIWILSWLVSLLDAIFGGLLTGVQALVPADASASLNHLRHVPGLGVVLVFTGLLITGGLVTHVAGRWWVFQWDRLFTHIPVFKTIYNSVKKVSDTLLASNGHAFRTALLVSYPRTGMWTIAFQTGIPGGEVAQHLGADWVSVYVPTTPNPTSGFFLILPKSEVIVLNMSVDEALTYVLSMGSVMPTASPDILPP